MASVGQTGTHPPQRPQTFKSIETEGTCVTIIECNFKSKGGPFQVEIWRGGDKRAITRGSGTGKKPFRSEKCEKSHFFL